MAVSTAVSGNGSSNRSTGRRAANDVARAAIAIASQATMTSASTGRAVVSATESRSGQASTVKKDGLVTKNSHSSSTYRQTPSAASSKVRA